MEEELDDAALVAMMVDDDEFNLETEQKKKPSKPKNLSFTQQAERLTSEELIQLTCSLVDLPESKINQEDIIQIKPTKQISATLSSGNKSQSTITATVFTEPNTHIRIDQMTLTPAEIKTKLSLTKFIRLSDIEKQTIEPGTEWCTMAIIATKSDVKQASNGSTYSIWRLTDFKTTMNLFLFGDAHQSLWKTNLSSVVLVYDGDAKKPGQLSIKQQRNLSILGVNPDLGQCKAKAKSGEQCKMLVDRHSCEYCVTHAHQHYKSGQNNSNPNRFSAANSSRMNLQSTGSFVPKKFADHGSVHNAATATVGPSRKFPKKVAESSKSNGNSLNEKEKSMLVMLGLEDDPLVCVRSSDSKGSSDSISDIRESYRARQAACKAKPIVFDETKRDDAGQMSLIRAYPHCASTSPEKPAAPLILKPSNSKPVPSPKQFVDLNKPASTEAMNSAKQRAIEILKQRLAQKQITPNKGQSLVQADLSSSPKRSFAESNCSVEESPKRMKSSNPEQLDKRFSEIMNMKSSHADLYNKMSLDEIFEHYKKKENIEEKLLQVMERDIKVVVCRVCKYTAYKQSVICKEKQHYVKICEVKQKFFECLECKKRVFTWSQYPVENCTRCHSLRGFRRTALIPERVGLKFDDEILLLRGEEIKFLNSFANYQKLPDVVDS